MVDIIIVLLLVMGFLLGLRRGLVLQLVKLVSFIIAYLVAYWYCKDLAPALQKIIPYPFKQEVNVPNWIDANSMETVFYQAIAFIALFIITKIALTLIGQLLNMFTEIPVLKQINALGGAILGFLEVYIILFVLIVVGTILPIEQLQTSLNQSSISKVIVEDTPILSGKVKELWQTGSKV
ncbi:CvpA family protein [Bacillus cytotoxicus]|uniref:CvpA family protein n=1 Tax=Bacillus cytotoxicus TaxID=580165 RepID=A0ACC6AA64_9BACI|nr:CvpA family protein [Bacillus cytotoxicus]HDX9576825.1 CvpA family protein [Bacillus pseudomycoides]